MLSQSDAPPNAAVGVVIPVRNGARYIAEALASVLAQTRPAAEVIVVDDGSTDATPAVVAGFADRGVRLVRQDAAGAAAARNHGVGLTRSPLLAFLDADDLWLPDKLARQGALLMAGAGNMIFGGVEEFVSPDVAGAGASGLFPPPKLHADPLHGPTSITMLIARADFMRVGDFDPRWQVGEFIDWYGRAQDTGLRPALVPAVVARRRLHAANLGRHNHHQRGQYAQVLKAMLDRRRADAASAASRSVPPGAR